MTHNRRQSPADERQQGFALLETLIAIVVLMIGLLAVLATFAMAIGNTNSVQLDSIARQKATEALESIFTARQTSQITFAKIQNVGAGAGIFTRWIHSDDRPWSGRFGRHGGRCSRRPDAAAGSEWGDHEHGRRMCWSTWAISRGRFRSRTCPATRTFARLRSPCVIRCRRAGSSRIRCKP